MKVSLERAVDYIDLPAGVSVKELAHQLTLKTVEVEYILPVDGDSILEIDNKSLRTAPTCGATTASPGSSPQSTACRSGRCRPRHARPPWTAWSAH